MHKIRNLYIIKIVARERSKQMYGRRRRRPYAGQTMAIQSDDAKKILC